MLSWEFSTYRIQQIVWSSALKQPWPMIQIYFINKINYTISTYQISRFRSYSFYWTKITSQKQLLPFFRHSKSFESLMHPLSDWSYIPKTHIYFAVITNYNCLVCPLKSNYTIHTWFLISACKSYEILIIIGSILVFEFESSAFPIFKSDLMLHSTFISRSWFF